MYSEYISKFDTSLKVLSETMKRNVAFCELVKEFEVNDTAGFGVVRWVCRCGWTSVVGVSVCRPNPGVPTSVWPATCWRLFRGYPAISCCSRVGHAHRHEQLTCVCTFVLFESDTCQLTSAVISV